MASCKLAVALVLLFFISHLLLSHLRFADIRSRANFGLSGRGGSDVAANSNGDGVASCSSNSGSGIFGRFVQRNQLDGDYSFYCFHTGIVQINGSRGATFASLQNSANALFAFFFSHRHMLEPLSESEDDGSKRKRRRIAWQMGTPDNIASLMPL